MAMSVAVRRSAHKRTLPAVLAPESFAVVVSRVVTQDRVEVAMRRDHAGSVAGARALALRLLAAVACSGAATVDVLDGHGAPIFFAQAAGGSL